VQVTSTANAQESNSGLTGWRSQRLAEELKGALVKQHFEDVLDTSPVTPPAKTAAQVAKAAALATRRKGEERGYERQPGDAARRPAQSQSLAAAAAPTRIHQQPNVDLAVIELDSQGRTIAAADVIQSPQYPAGKIVPLNANLSTDQVRYRMWDDDTWDTNGGQGKIDAVAGHENAPIDFMSPYPASVIKLMVGFGVLQLVDKGELALDDVYHYDPTGAPNKACGGKTDKTIRQLFDEMITISSNAATCSLIKLQHEHGAVDPLNKRFADLGLPMLQLRGTRTVDGGRWIDMQMGALDTAKLLLILNGSAGPLWTAPDGTPVTRDELSASSREFFLSKLSDQGINQSMSTPNWCGRTYPAPGIPQVISERWINPVTGTVTVDGRNYNQDVRPCQATAEVTFQHKPGLTDTSGNDAGIVHSLPGKPGRHYIVVAHANIGDRYLDPNRPADPPNTFKVPVSEKYAKLGKLVDSLIVCHRNR
jgi:beta-lactamase class A